MKITLPQPAVNSEALVKHHKIALLPGEQVVTSSNKNLLTLTTKRIRYDSQVVGASSFISITLDSVASCGVATRSYPILLILAFIAFGAAFTPRINQPLCFVLAAVLALFYFASRRATLSIASNGGDTIHVPTRGMNRTSIIELIDAVEREKLK